MRTEVVKYRLDIGIAGQKEYFSIKLPKDVQRLIGIETGLQVHSLLQDNERDAAGFLQLQASEKANHFYSNQIPLRGYRLENFTLGTPTPAVNDSIYQWMQADDTALTAFEPTPLLLKNCHQLYGCYTDEWGKGTWSDKHYSLYIYLWIERNS